MLSLTDVQRMIEIKCILFQMLEEEELYWFKRSHERLLHKGDNNTDYFHRITNGRRRRNTIVSLMDGDQIIEGMMICLLMLHPITKRCLGLHPAMLSR